MPKHFFIKNFAEEKRLSLSPYDKVAITMVCIVILYLVVRNSYPSLLSVRPKLSVFRKLNYYSEQQLLGIFLLAPV